MSSLLRMTWVSSCRRVASPIFAATCTALKLDGQETPSQPADGLPMETAMRYPILSQSTDTRPGKRLHNYGKSPCSMGKLIINIFKSPFSIAMLVYQKVLKAVLLTGSFSENHGPGARNDVGPAWLVPIIQRPIPRLAS